MGLFRADATSSTVAIVAATAFLALATMLSFVGDPADATAGWRLRGTLAPPEAPRQSLENGTGVTGGLRM